AIVQSHQEVLKMGEGAVKMLNWTREIVFEPAVNGNGNGSASTEQLVRKVFHREEVLDAVEREMVAFLTEVLDGSVSHTVADQARQQLRVAHEYESISDVAASILKAFLKLREDQVVLSDQQLKALAGIHNDVATYVKMVYEAHLNEDADIVTEAQ